MSEDDTDGTPEAWFLMRQRIEVAWEHREGALLTSQEVETLRGELEKLLCVLDKALDMSGGLVEGQHARDLQALLVRLGYLEPRVVGRA